MMPLFLAASVWRWMYAPEVGLSTLPSRPWIAVCELVEKTHP